MIFNSVLHRDSQGGQERGGEYVTTRDTEKHSDTTHRRLLASISHFDQRAKTKQFETSA